MNVSIYIENYKLDTNDNTIVALTMCYSYVEDPTTIAGDYSKSITVQGTVNNNKIFGQFWNIDRVALESDSSLNTGVYFNASKRTNAKIYLGNDLFKSGYVQLNAVNKVNGNITYEITFYSELCNMLHEIMDSSLSALGFPGSLAHTINTSAIASNLNGTGPLILNTSSALSDYVHYGLSLDGVFDNFNPSKWLTYDTANKKWVVADIDSNGTSYDTAMILESPSNRVRPYIKVSSLLNQIRDDYNESTNNDTLLKYDDPYFFNSTNPYVGNTVLSGKVYSTENTSTSFSNIYFDDFTVNGGLSNAIYLKAKGSDLADEKGFIDLTSFTVIPHVELECMLAIDGSLNGTQYSNAIKNAVYTTGRQFTSTGNFVPYFTLQRMADDSSTVLENRSMVANPIYPGWNGGISLSQIKDKHNTVLSPLVFESIPGTANFELAFKNCVYNETDMRLDCSQTPCTYIEELKYDKRYTNLDCGGMDSAMVDYTDNNDKIGVTDFFPFKFHVTNLKPGKYRLRVHISSRNVSFKIRDCADYSFGDSSTAIAMTSFKMRGRFNTKSGNNTYQLRNPMLYRNRQPLQSYLANNLEDTTVESTTGISFSISSSSGTSTGSTVSFADMVDAETSQGDFLVNYTKLFGLVYDTDNVNTDHTIKIKTRDYYHQDYKIIDWTDKIDYSQTFKHEPLSFSTKYLSLNYNSSDSYYAKKYSNTFDTSYGVQLIDTGYEFNSDTSTLIDNQIMKQAIMVKGESRFKGICPAFFDKSDNSRSPIDGQYSFLFWNTDKSDCYKQSLFIYDDNDAMHDSSNGGDENMCFVDTESLKQGGISLIGQWLNIPAPNSLRDSFSTDLGYPRANYAGWNINTYPSSGTLFNGFWNRYITDLYNSNTQIITAYVHLSPLEIMNFSFKNFIKIKDTLWHPNKIEDYNPLSTKPVSVELVKVNDINAYTNSQIKFYEYFRAEFNVYTNDSTIPASKILTPVAGGIVSGSSTNQYYGNFRFGTKWSQGFTTVAPYTKVGSVEAFYYDNEGDKIDCSDWFDIYTYTFTCKEIPTSDVTVNIRMDENVVYYNVGVELDNAQVKWITPVTEITRIKSGDPIKMSYSLKEGLDSSYKLAYAVVEMDAVNISASVIDFDSNMINIPSVTGDVVINIAYAQFDDILLPWIKVTNTADNIGYLEIPNTGNVNGIRFTNSFSFGVYETQNDSSSGIYVSRLYINNDGTNVYANSIMLNKGSNYRITNEPGTQTYASSYFNVDNSSPCVITIGEDSYNNSTWKYKSYTYDNKKNKLGNSVFEYNGKPIKSNAYYLINNLQFFYYYPRSATNSLTLRFVEVRYEDYDALVRVSVPHNRIIPMLHYDKNEYKPKFYDCYSKQYLDLTIKSGKGTPKIEYDTTSKADIPLQWIGNNNDNPGYYNVGSCNADTGIVMYYYTNYKNINEDNYLICTNDEIVEYTTSQGNIIQGTCRNFIRITKDKVVQAEYGMYYTSDGGIGSLSQFRMSVYYSLADVNNINITYLMPSKDPNFIHYPKLSNNVSSMGSVEHTDVNVETTMYLFKQPNKNVFTSKIRLMYLKVTTNANTIRYYTPVLHFTGDKTQYISNEGFKVPLGYTPCLYESLNKQYVFLSTGSPSFGFKHNS